MKTLKSITEAQMIHARVERSSSMSYPSWSANVVTSVAKHLVLQEPFFKDGERWQYKAKSLGAGVQKVTIIKA